MSELPKHKPLEKVYPEQIGDTQYMLPERKLDIFEDVALWYDNPRVTPMTAEKQPESEAELEAYLQRTPGYAGLKDSIKGIGQLEPVYVWRREEGDQYLVLEGSTRVAILRELSRMKEGTPDAEKYGYVRAKVLPPEFDEMKRAILLARIHVRGSGVRGWGRYIEAKFIYEHVESVHGSPPVMTMADMAANMGKSMSWVSRLKHAYQFGSQYVEYLDSNDAQQEAVKKFSTLEEISKATGFGRLLKDDEKLRHEVFEMVHNDVFKEYRDARFMKQYYDDPEKWGQLKGHERHIAHALANEIKVGGTSVKARIAALSGQIERTMEANPELLGEDDVDELGRAVQVLSSAVTGLNQFRLTLAQFTRALMNASLSEVKAVTQDELDRLDEGLEDFRARWDRHHGTNKVAA